MPVVPDPNDNFGFAPVRPGNVRPDAVRSDAADRRPSESEAMAMLLDVKRACEDLATEVRRLREELQVLREAAPGDRRRSPASRPR